MLYAVVETCENAPLHVWIFTARVDAVTFALDLVRETEDDARRAAKCFEADAPFETGDYAISVCIASDHQTEQENP